MNKLSESIWLLLFKKSPQGVSKGSYPRFRPSLPLFPARAQSCLQWCVCKRVVVTQWLSPSLCDPWTAAHFPVLHYLPEFAQTHIHWISDAIQPSHPLSPPSPSAFSLSLHQGLFQWVSCSDQVAKVLELQSFWWIFRVDFL